MDAGAEPELGRRLEDRAGLLETEGALLDEDVAALREPLRGDRGQHLFDDLADVVAAVAPALRRDDVGAEEGGHHREGLARLQGGVDP